MVYLQIWVYLYWYTKSIN